MKRYTPVFIAVGVILFLVVLRALVISHTPSGKNDGTGELSTGPDANFISIGTGAVTGVYYQVGGAIMKLMNSKQAEYGLRVSFQATGGSVYNINALLSEDLDLGVVQSDRQYQAYNGIAEWSDKGMQTALRAICSFHPESVTLVAAVDSDIATLEDLRAKRVNIGNPGSGQRGNANDVLRTAGIDWRTDIQAESLKAVESSKLLQDGRIDAFFYTVGHPAGAITEATAGRRKVRFVPILDMENLIRTSPYYAPAKIPIKLYPKAENKEDVPTIGVMTTLVTTDRVPESVIYAITKEIFENLGTFKQMHPAFSELSRKEMVNKGISAPYHPGALKYYREAGLMK